MYPFSLVFSGYFVIPCMYRLWNLICCRRGWIDHVPAIRREQVYFLNKCFQPLTSCKSGTRRNRAPCMVSSGISNRLYHLFDLPKSVSPGIKAADAAPRTVLNTFLGKGIASSQRTSCEPILDFCLWWMYAFSAWALSLPSFAATGEGPRAVLSHLWTVCGLLWKGQWMVTRKNKPSSNEI